MKEKKVYTHYLDVETINRIDEILKTENARHIAQLSRSMLINALLEQCADNYDKDQERVTLNGYFCAN